MAGRKGFPPEASLAPPSGLCRALLSARLAQETLCLPDATGFCRDPGELPKALKVRGEGPAPSPRLLLNPQQTAAELNETSGTERLHGTKVPSPEFLKEKSHNQVGVGVGRPSPLAWGHCPTSLGTHVCARTEAIVTPSTPDTPSRLRRLLCCPVTLGHKPGP